jgi:ABC-2 type transport system permease protein
VRGTIRNILVIARREFLARSRTRSFRIATVLLVVAGVAVALAPIGIRWFDRGSQDKVGVTGPADMAFSPADTLAAFLNANSTGETPPYAVAVVPSLEEAKAAVERGDLSAVLVMARNGSGDLDFTVVTKETAGRRTPELLRIAATGLGRADRLARLGVTPEEQAALAAPISVTLVKPMEPKPGETPQEEVDVVSGVIVGQVLVIFLFLAIILYGQWIAMSVAVEKSSRVMEVILNAASPFELLGGKIVGVGGLGLVQYAAAFVPATVALLFQDQISALILGGGADSGTPAALTAPVLATFAVFFILGFVLYAVLYAAAGSLVSRMEEVNNVIGPMSIISVAGYMIAVYASSGLLPADAAWITALSFFPLVSPFLMLSRVLAGEAGLFDVALAAVILVVTIGACLWAAARVYEAGVLMYGQRPSFRTLFTLAFRRR